MYNATLTTPQQDRRRYFRACDNLEIIRACAPKMDPKQGRKMLARALMEFRTAAAVYRRNGKAA